MAVLLWDSRLLRAGELSRATFLNKPGKFHHSELALLICVFMPLSRQLAVSWETGRLSLIVQRI